MIPLVVLDIDGTLIGSSKRVEPCVWEAADRARKAGVRLAVSTGRPGFGVAREVAERLDPTAPHIFQNGAHATFLNGSTVHVSGLREKNAMKLVEMAREWGTPLELYTPDALYVERKTEVSEAHAKMLGTKSLVRDLAEVVESEPVIRAQWLATNEDLPVLEANTLPGTTMNWAVSPALSGVYFVSVTREGTDKGTALEKLASSLGASLQDVMVVGDSPGDLPMLERVGHPRVMASGDEGMVATYAAERGVPGVDECGAAVAIDQAVELKPVVQP